MDISLGLLVSFISFLVLFLFIGAVAANRGKNTEDDYLLGSRSFGRWMIGLSAGATANTSFIIIAAVAMGYTMGYAALLFWIAVFIGDATFWSIAARRVSAQTQQSRAETVAEVAVSNLKSGANSVRTVISLIIAVFVGAYVVAQLAGAAKVLEVYFNMDTSTGIVVATAAILAYTTTGGLRASIWTDIVQAVLMICLTVGMASYTLYLVGGFGALTTGLSAADPEMINLFAGMGTWQTLAYVVGFAALGFSFGLASPHVTVRVMAGRTPEEIQATRPIFLAFHYGTGTCMVLFGMCLKLLMPELVDPEQGLAAFTMENFSPWLIGLVLAGIFSTIASSADSQILACSSALSHDFLPKLSQRMYQRLGVRYHQLVTLAFGIVAAVVTINSSSTVFDLVVLSISILGASLGAVMIIMLLRRPCSAVSLNIAMVLGVATALAWRSYGLGETLNETAPGMLITLLANEVFSAVFPAKEEPSEPEEEVLVTTPQVVNQ